MKVTYIYLLSELVYSLMYVRIFFLVRAILNYTQYHETYARKLCKSYGFEPNTFFTIKSLLMIHPAQTCLILFSFTIVIFTIWVRIFEMPFQRASSSHQFDDYKKALWLTVVSLFTIGYGDLYPSSDLGKLLIILLAFWGAILLALLVVACSNIFNIEGR